MNQRTIFLELNRPRTHVFDAAALRIRKCRSSDYCLGVTIRRGLTRPIRIRPMPDGTAATLSALVRALRNRLERRARD